MARMIDGERTAKTFSEHPFAKFYGFQVAEEIKETPSVDAVKVVRCEDCKYFLFHACYPGKCSNQIGLTYCTGKDYCSNGVAKNE